MLCCGASPKRRGASVRGLRGRGPCGCSEICRKLDFERMTLVAAGRGPQNRRWWLVGGLEPWNFMTFHILGIVTPTDFHIFQRGRYTTNQIKCLSLPSDVWLFGTRSLPGNVIDYVFKWAAGRGSERGRHVKSRLTRLAFNNTFVCTKGISWIMIQTYPNSDKSVGCLFATFMESRKK